jgi:hypothetical protein
LPVNDNAFGVQQSASESEYSDAGGQHIIEIRATGNAGILVLVNVKRLRVRASGLNLWGSDRISVGRSFSQRS